MTTLPTTARAAATRWSSDVVFPVAPGVSARGREGQSVVEASLVTFLITLILLGLFQVSRLYVAREILHHAAYCGARAKTVGFNRSMVEKTIMVGLIPIAGHMTTPDVEIVHQELRDALADNRTGRSGRVWDVALTSTPGRKAHWTDEERVRDFLGSDTVDDGRAYYLDYADWDDIGFNASAPAANATVVHVTAEYAYPLRVPLHRSFVAADEVHLSGESYLESHYNAYMDDEGR